MIDRIFELHSYPPLSPYAPKYKFNLSRSVWDDEKKIDKIKKFLLKKEKAVLKLAFNSDGDTGLGKDSVTTRFARYNLFDFIDECPELEDLWEFIQKHYYQRIAIDKTGVYNTKIVCWFNVLRQGEEIKAHRHTARFSAYLSGNLHLDNYHTSTTYKHLDNWQSIDNVKGGLIMFPSHLLHEVNVYNDQYPRVSIAFDLHLTNLNDIDNEALRHYSRDFTYDTKKDK
jgi:hypothetical protein|tara:strand:+ start:2502 stop:3182 length:681 start_codon:yes stop_codon:yes gene_type:complete